MTDSAANTLYHYMTQHIVSKALVIACEMNLDKKLEEEMRIDQLAKECQFDSVALLRFLRLLEAHEIVSIEGDKVKSTPLCKALNQMRGPHLLQGHKVIDALSYALQTNSECYSKVTGKSFAEVVKEDPHEQQRLQEWADQTAAQWLIPSIFDLYDFSTYPKICEIGGWGHLSQALLLKNPALQIEHIKAIENVDAIPLGFNAYIFCRSLLSFSDSAAIKLLQQCKERMSENSFLFIIDYYLPEKNHPDYKLSTIADLNILSFLNGSLRNKPQWEYIIQHSGLKLDSFIAIDRHEKFVKPSSMLPLFVLKSTP